MALTSTGICPWIQAFTEASVYFGLPSGVFSFFIAVACCQILSMPPAIKSCAAPCSLTLPNFSASSPLCTLWEYLPNSIARRGETLLTCS